MAAAGPSPLGSSEEKTNGSKLSRLLIDGGTTVLRNVFNYHHPPANLAADLNASYSTLNNLKRRRVLNGHQWDKLFPPGGAMPDSNTFDITLLFLLLTNICGLAPPPTGWHTKPPASDNSHEANLARVKYFRNVLYGHVTSTGVDTHSFSVLWREISAVLVALRLQQSEVDRLKAERGGEEDYLDALREWADCEIDIKTQLKENTLKLEEVHQVVTEIRQAQVNMDQEEDILRKLAKVDTENIIRYHSERYLEGTRKSVFTKVNDWLEDGNSPHRVMVIVGNAGMGKSVIAAELSKRMLEEGKLSGSHFCQHDRVRHRNPKVMLQSLAYQLSHSLPDYKKALVKQLSRNLGVEINDMEVGDLFELLFEEPLSRLTVPNSTCLVIIDALDESEYQGRNELLDVIAKCFNKLPLWIRFLVTTRPEINICDSLKGLQPLLLEPSDEENLKDIRFLFEKQLSCKLQSENHEVIFQELAQKSEGLILWAQLLTDFITENDLSFLTLEELNCTVPSGISSIFQSYFTRLESELCKELKITEDQFLDFLSAITAAREPLPVGFVSKLLFPGKISSAFQRKVSKAITCISSLLPVQDGCVHFFHKSLKDWLSDKIRFSQHNHSVDENEGHRILSDLCIGELDEVKRKGVHRSEQLSDTTKYALQHGVQHILELDEDTRPCSFEDLVNYYVLDLEIVYAKLLVNIAVASEDIVSIMKFCVEKKSVAESLLFLLKMHSRELNELPHVIFQTLLNEGGPDLFSKASSLLKAKYSNISYIEYLNKNDLQGPVQTTFYCSSEVACFDVSPQSDYMVCECRDATLQLWSLHTGNLLWKRPAFNEKLYRDWHYESAFKTSRVRGGALLSRFNSVIFHPSKDVILPGVLSHAYSFNGELTQLYRESHCCFSICALSGDKILTDCPNDAKCLILWSLLNGREITRTVRDEDVLTFALSQDGGLLAVSHSTGAICLLDVINDFRTLTKVEGSKGGGMMKFSPDRRRLYCWYFYTKGCNFRVGEDRLCYTVSNEDNGKVSLEVTPHRCVFEDPYAFLLGDSVLASSADVFFSYDSPSFLFVLNKQSVLQSYPGSDIIKVLSLKKIDLKKDSFRKPFVRNIVFSINGETLYLVTSENGYAQITAWDSSSGELKAEKKDVSASDIFGTIDCHLAAVREGVLFTTSKGTAELWNSDLTERIRSWRCDRNVTGMFPISDERVVFNFGRKAIILDTQNNKKLIPFSGLGLLACNSKSQVVTISEDYPRYKIIHMRNGDTLLWKFELPNTISGSARLRFSPNEEFLVIWGRSRAVYVLDPSSGKLWGILQTDSGTMDLKFVSDENCVVLSPLPYGHACCLQLFNIRSGDLLSLIDVETYPYLIASCPAKGLIACALTNSEDLFKVIQIRFSGCNRDSQRSLRSVITCKCGSDLVNDFLYIFSNFCDDELSEHLSGDISLHCWRFFQMFFFSRLWFKLERYKAERKLSSGQTSSRRGMRRGEKEE